MRHRLHHEPVHRAAGFPGLVRASGRGEDRGALRLNAFGRRRRACPSVRPWQPASRTLRTQNPCGWPLTSASRACLCAIDLSLVSERSPPGRGGLPPPARPDVQGLQVVADLLVLRILRLGLRKILAGAAQVAAQKVRVAAVVEEFRRRADQLKGLGVGAVGEPVALELVIGSGEPEPGLGVVLAALDRAAEMHLGEAVVPGAEMLLAERNTNFR